MRGGIGTYSYDCAKTVTTREDGMIERNNRSLWSKATALLEHGHKENATIERREEPFQSGGSNYGMCALQPAIDIAQLKNLDWIAGRQRESLRQSWESGKNTRGLEPRDQSCKSHGPSADLRFLSEANQKREHAEQLLTKNVASKILPEAIKWDDARY